MKENKTILQHIPSIDEILRSERMETEIAVHGRQQVAAAIKTCVEEIRSEVLNNKAETAAGKEVLLDEIYRRVNGRLAAAGEMSLRKAVNGAGIVLHTGLGRARLAEAAVRNIHDIISGYCTLAIDAETGMRGHRDVHCTSLLCELTGAEDATVVNNNAAATMLILNTLANGKEVIVSRGQLVEIGGSFRMPDVMEQSGAILREIGTTNKVHLKDYKQAINDNTGAILHVHQSNYRIMGFFSEPSIEELTELGREHGLPVIDDLGSGALIDLSIYGLEKEPMVQESVKAGADVICFSGDKLIGGPQSGIIVGKKAVVERVRKNQLARAFRIGKMTIAGLEATLRLFRNREALERDHPFYRMLALPMEGLKARAERVADLIRESVGDAVEITVCESEAQVGSGSVPTETVASIVLSIRPSGMSAAECARRLRNAKPAIVPRVQKDAVLLDFRTISPDEDEVVCRGVCGVLENG